MARTRRSAKTAGTRTASEVAAYLTERLQRQHERRALTGAEDCGDITGTEGWVISVKDCATFKPAEWAKDAEKMAANAQKRFHMEHDWMIVAKRRMKPIEDAYCIIPLKTMTGLMLMEDELSELQEE